MLLGMTLIYTTEDILPTAAGTFHVPVFPVSDSDGTGGNGVAAPLRHVWDLHARRADHQELMDGKI